MRIWSIKPRTDRKPFWFLCVPHSWVPVNRQRTVSASTLDVNRCNYQLTLVLRNLLSCRIDSRNFVNSNTKGRPSALKKDTNIPSDLVTLSPYWLLFLMKEWSGFNNWSFEDLPRTVSIFYDQHIRHNSMSVTTFELVTTETEWSIRPQPRLFIQTPTVERIARPLKVTEYCSRRVSIHAANKNQVKVTNQVVHRSH